jgi:hypothetical protein
VGCVDGEVCVVDDSLSDGGDGDEEAGRSDQPQEQKVDHMPKPTKDQKDRRREDHTKPAKKSPKR